MLLSWNFARLLENRKIEVAWCAAKIRKGANESLARSRRLKCEALISNENKMKLDLLLNKSKTVRNYLYRALVKDITESLINKAFYELRFGQMVTCSVFLE
jgi:hypothetical protein